MSSLHNQKGLRRLGGGCTKAGPSAGCLHQLSALFIALSPNQRVILAASSPPDSKAPHAAWMLYHLDPCHHQTDMFYIHETVQTNIDEKRADYYFFKSTEKLILDFLKSQYQHFKILIIKFSVLFFHKHERNRPKIFICFFSAGSLCNGNTVSM